MGVSAPTRGLLLLNRLTELHQEAFDSVLQYRADT